MTPEEPPKPTAPQLEITLEEWIAATQSCCGIDLPDDPPDTPSTASES